MVDLTILSKKELIGVLFSVINSKVDKYTFYCPSEYSKCLKDIEEISNDELLLTHLNNFVHPYNSFTNIKTTIAESGEITITVKLLYQGGQKADLTGQISERHEVRS